MYTVEKAPDELIGIETELGHLLAESESISSVTITAVLVATGATAISGLKIANGALLADGSQVADGSSGLLLDYEIGETSFNMRIQEGVDGELYKVTAKGNTSANNVFEADYFISVKEGVEGTYTKQPSERFTIDIPFEDALGEETSMAALPVVAIRLSDGADVTSSIINLSELYDDTFVRIKVQAGTNQEDYMIIAQALSAEKYIYQRAFILQVREG